MGRDAIAAIRDYVLDGAASGRLAAGDRLPTERALAERFAASRAAVRQAMLELEIEGRVTRHVGRGTFVARAAPAPRGAAETPDVSPAGLLEARLALEPAIAELVALNATEADLAGLRALVDGQAGLDGFADFEDADARFHEALAAATHNAMIEAATRPLTAARRGAEWLRLKRASKIARPERRAAAVAEHAAIVAALADRDAAAARHAMRRHLAMVRANLLGE